MQRAVALAKRPSGPNAPDIAARCGLAFAFGDARQHLQQPVYAQRLAEKDKESHLQLHVPLMDKAKFVGVVLAEYSVDGLYRYGVPAEISARYAVSLLDALGTVQISTEPQTQGSGSAFAATHQRWVSILVNCCKSSVTRRRRLLRCGLTRP